MNRSELIEALAKQKNLKIDEATKFVDDFFDTIKGALVSGARVEIRSLGSFTIKCHQGFTGSHPRTGAKIEIGPKRLPFFKAGKELKDFING